jgi:hypothetical protein
MVTSFSITIQDTLYIGSSFYQNLFDVFQKAI